MKRKIKDYLPLHWCKFLREQTVKYISDDFDANKAFDVMEAWHALETKERKHALEICNTFYASGNFQSLENDMLFECVEEIDTHALLRKWETNKQVFKFDAEFTDALVDTKGLSITQDSFKYLPYSVFYVDISDNKRLCQEIVGEGFFVTARLRDERWFIHLCRVTDTYYFSDVLTVSNETGAIKLRQEVSEVNIMDLDVASRSVARSTQKIDYNLYQTLIVQILTYLSSTEPDVRENPETKTTYRKPTGAPKNKYSEIQKWDVGVRIGTAIRSYSKRAANGTSSGDGANTKKRPHSRRAHWHYYWYGPKNGERVCRQRWVSEMFINMRVGDDAPAVIHMNDGKEGL